MKLNHLPILLSLSILTGFASSQVLAQSVLLNTEDSYVFEFNSLTFLGPFQRPDVEEHGWVIARFAPYSLSAGDSLSLEFFPDTLSDVPLSFVYSETDLAGTGRPIIAWESDETSWSDLQGIIRVTMLTGNATLTGFHIDLLANHASYREDFIVPEPSVLALGLICAGSLALSRRQSRQHDSSG